MDSCCALTRGQHWQDSSAKNSFFPNFLVAKSRACPSALNCILLMLTDFCFIWCKSLFLVEGSVCSSHCSASYAAGLQLCCRLPFAVTLFSAAWGDTQAVPQIWFCHKGVQSGTWGPEGKQAARPNDERRGFAANCINPTPPTHPPPHPITYTCTHLRVAARWQSKGPGVSTQLSPKSVYRATGTVYRSTWRLQSHPWRMRRAKLTATTWHLNIIKTSYNTIYN